MPNEEDEAGFELDFDKLLFIARRGILWFALFAVLSALGVFLYLRYTPKLYKAESTLKLELESQTDILGESFYGNQFNTEQQLGNLAGEIEIIKSEQIYNKVIDSLDLSVGYFAKGDVIDSEIWGSKPFRIIYNEDDFNFYDQPVNISFSDENKATVSYFKLGELVEIDVDVNSSFEVSGNELYLDYSGDMPLSNRYFFIIHSYPYLKNYLSDRLDLTVLNQAAKTLSLSFEDNNRQKAIDLLHVINAVYSMKSLETKNQQFDQGLSFISNKLEETEDSLFVLEQRILSLRKKQGIPTSLGEGIVNKITSLNDEAEQLRLKLKALNQASVILLNSSLEDDVFQFQAMVDAPALLAVIEQYLPIKTNFERVQAAYRPTTATYQNQLKELQKIEEKLKTTLSVEQSRLQDEIRAIEAKLFQLRGNYYSAYDPTETELSKFEMTHESYKNLINSLQSYQIEMNMKKASTTPSFQVLQEPYASPVPIYPLPTIIYGIGAVAWIFLCFMYVFIAYISQNKVSTIKQLDKLSKAPLLGLIPVYNASPMELSRLVVNENPKSSISESFRSIRTNLDFMGIPHETSGKQAKLISFTSTISGEGKTFVSINLAGVLAMSGKKVVIIDLDLRKPKIHHGFGASNLKGMSNLLVGSATIEEVKQKADAKNISTLDFITAGPIPPNPSELLMSGRFKNIIEQLKEEYDFILMDMPPIGLVTDGFIAMRMATVQIYVLRADYSKVDFVKGINRLMAEKKFDNIALVFNAAGRSATYGYGYGYGYIGGSGSTSSHGYGGYYEEGDVTDTRSWWQKILRR